MKMTMGKVTLEAVTCTCGTEPVKAQRGTFMPYHIECPNCGVRGNCGFLIDAVADWNALQAVRCGREASVLINQAKET